MCQNHLVEPFFIPNFGHALYLQRRQSNVVAGWCWSRSLRWCVPPRTQSRPLPKVKFLSPKETPSKWLNSLSSLLHILHLHLLVAPFLLVLIYFDFVTWFLVTSAGRESNSRKTPADKAPSPSKTGCREGRLSAVDPAWCGLKTIGKP